MQGQGRNRPVRGLVDMARDAEEWRGYSQETMNAMVAERTQLQTALAAARAAVERLREQVTDLSKADLWRQNSDNERFSDFMPDELDNFGDEDVVELARMHLLPNAWASYIPTEGVVVNGKLEVDAGEWREFPTREEAEAARDIARAALLEAMG